MTVDAFNRSIFQHHPFHLVSPSPWPLYTCISLLTLTTSGVLTMHGFNNSNVFVLFAFISLVLSMSFWWRGATVRLHNDLLRTRRLAIVICENHSTTYRSKWTLLGDHSLCRKGGTGVERSLDPSRVKAVNQSKMGQSWILDLYGPSKPVGR